jgi:nucleotide-binding universal stress UspA family protein
MNLIIAATDFSPASQNAVKFAADMALSLHAKLVLFHAYSMPVSYTDVPVIIASVDELKTAADNQLFALKENILTITGNKITIETLSKMGNTIDELEEFCTTSKPFAVVMGSKSKTEAEKLFFGSNTLTAIRQLTCPVLAVPIGKEFGHGIKKIGFACDFREVAATTPVLLLKQIVITLGASLHIVNIDYKNKNFRPDTPEQSFLLHQLLEELRPQYHFLNNSVIEEGITEFAETNNLDLIIAIPKKHKLLDAIFKPSSTKKLVFQSHIPVMCIHE